MPPPEKQGVQRCLRWQLAPGQIALPPPPYIRVAGGGGGGGKFTKSRRCQVSEKAAPIDLQQINGTHHWGLLTNVDINSVQTRARAL